MSSTGHEARSVPQGQMSAATQIARSPGVANPNPNPNQIARSLGRSARGIGPSDASMRPTAASAPPSPPPPALAARGLPQSVEPPPRA
eukprot:scaffold1203_cov74-Phaeocystis_antarctica.AAC.1